MKILYALSLLSFITLTQGCASNYTTPAGGVNISELTDVDIAEIMQREPESSFPARLAVVRVQTPGYVSKTNDGYGTGRYSVLTARDAESASDFEKLSNLPMVSGMAPLSRLLLPAELNSIKDLRVSAASLKTDLLLIYSIDTVFHVEGTPLGPLSLVTLGFLPNQKAHVSSTTSGLLVDVRTGYIYGVTEATEREEQRTTIWNSVDAIDEARINAEGKSFAAFVTEVESFWEGVLAQYDREADI